MIDKQNGQPQKKRHFQPQLQLALAHARAHVRTLQTDSELEAAARIEVTSHLKTMNRPRRKRMTRRRASKHRRASRLNCHGQKVHPKQAIAHVIEEYHDFKFQVRPEAEDCNFFSRGSRSPPALPRNRRKQQSKTLAERRTCCAVVVPEEIIQKCGCALDPPGRYPINPIVTSSIEHKVLSFKDQANDRFDLDSTESTEGASKACQGYNRQSYIPGPPMALAVCIGSDRIIMSKDDRNLFCFSILW